MRVREPAAHTTLTGAHAPAPLAASTSWVAERARVRARPSRPRQGGGHEHPVHTRWGASACSAEEGRRRRRTRCHCPAPPAVIIALGSPRDTPLLALHTRHGRAPGPAARHEGPRRIHIVLERLHLVGAPWVHADRAWTAWQGTAATSCTHDARARTQARGAHTVLCLLTSSSLYVYTHTHTHTHTHAHTRERTRVRGSARSHTSLCRRAWWCSTGSYAILQRAVAPLGPAAVDAPAPVPLPARASCVHALTALPSLRAPLAD